MEELKKLPGIDKLLNLSETKSLIKRYGKELVTYSLRISISYYRDQIKNEKKAPSHIDIISRTSRIISEIANGSQKPVINASGIIIHTNLGRTPLGKELIKKTTSMLAGYSNLEFNLKTGKRSNRNVHASNILRFITGAEDILVVNNNAAAVILILNSFSKNKEVIVSRSELIEIGGSFRLPDIMKVAGCKMVEVGTTNKTRLSDYENAIKNNTALLFKAHKSNFNIKGFTEEAKLEELVSLGKKYNIPVVYDMGSGLLKKASKTALETEPDVRDALATGVDIVSFSGDKLLGGPQAGIIAGTSKMVGKLKKDPMMRALRVCKITLAFLENACRYYLDDNLLKEKNVFFQMLQRPKKELLANSELLKNELKKQNINSRIIKSFGQYGGGSMPDNTIDSYSVVIEPDTESRKKRSEFVKKMYLDLLSLEKPVLGILKQGEVHFDVLTIFQEDIIYIAKAISKTYKEVLH